MTDNETQDLAEQVARIIIAQGLLRDTDIRRGDDIPPAPINLKDRKWTRLSGTVDSELFKCFEEERQRLQVSTSRMLDIVLWRALGRPKLSYLQEEQT